MKDNMLVMTCLGLLLHWMLPVTSAKIIFHLNESKPTPDIVHMDIAENSVDDMYFNCLKEMTKKVQKIFKEEIKDKTFHKVWKEAKKCVKSKKKVHKALTKDHIQAICLYTAEGEERFYGTFNNAVRTGGSSYGTSFRYHSFHFWLTSAIQILNQQQCRVTYRRTKHQVENKVNDVIRFGIFASTSLRTNLIQFGRETCFCIYTCYGAYLEKYPQLKDYEQEVLIPPYEMFKITDKDCQLGCKKNYYLKSEGIMSRQNCKVVRS